jgi:hypothetical protein
LHPGCDRLSKRQNAGAERVLVVGRIRHPLLPRLNDEVGRRKIRISHPQRNNIDPAVLRGFLLPINLGKKVGRELLDTLAVFHGFLIISRRQRGS